ncbi:HNH endonuclease family protein [Sinosporangium siamense]|nr:HNH endonuclease family protein [Sinosporangium siamense]
MTIFAALAVAATLAGPAVAAPPPPPDPQTARAQLAALEVRPSGPTTGYYRTLFPHWNPVEASCDTREAVLKRDAIAVVTDAQCRSVAGTWYSPYDGVTWTMASDIDIDHMVPLSEAWKSGADRWNTARRQQFANDLGSSQLWAVTDSVNQGKGDKDPGVWMPPLESFHCAYARSWIDVKSRWGLAVDPAEKTALETALGTC